jgi:hypothetical protein
MMTGMSVSRGGSGDSSGDDDKVFPLGSTSLPSTLRRTTSASAAALMLLEDEEPEWLANAVLTTLQRADDSDSSDDVEFVGVDEAERRLRQAQHADAATPQSAAAAAGSTPTTGPVVASGGGERRLRVVKVYEI